MQGDEAADRMRMSNLGQRYSAYGFDILSDFPLPAWGSDAPAEGAEMVRVLDGGEQPRGCWQPDFAISGVLDVAAVSASRWIARCFEQGNPNEIFLEVDGGGTIRVMHCGVLSPGDAGRLVASVGLRLFAILRGLAVLHGSVVEMEATAFAILGDSGAGKSTTTAALLAAGATLITEELIVLQGTRAMRVEPGLPHISIRPELAGALPLGGNQMVSWERSGPGNEKVLWSPAGMDQPAAARLDAVCVLGERLQGGSAAELRLLERVEATSVLAANCYWSDKLPEANRKPSWKTAMLLAATVPVFRLRLPEGLDALFGAVCELPKLLERTAAGVRA